MFQSHCLILRCKKVEKYEIYDNFRNRDHSHNIINENGNNLVLITFLTLKPEFRNTSLSTDSLPCLRITLQTKEHMIWFDVFIGYNEKLSVWSPYKTCVRVCSNEVHNELCIPLICDNVLYLLITFMWYNVLKILGWFNWHFINLKPLFYLA